MAARVPKVGFENLHEEVVKPGLCIGCGACAASCSFDALSIGHEPKLIEKCPRCGFCYSDCPQTGDPAELEVRAFGRVPRDPDLGVYREALSVKSEDPEIRERCQDGGAVSSLLTSLLEWDFIDAAIVMGFDGRAWKPEPKVALTREDVLECGGTKYTPGPILLGLRQAVGLFLKERVAVVGTPCQVKALRQMQFGDRVFGHLADRLVLTIGLFCMESFHYEKFKKFVEDEFKIPLERVSKVDIKKGNLVVYSEGLKREIGVKSLRDCVNVPCLVCPDFVAELADISIGASGSPLGRSTVFVRTEAGAKAFELARKSPTLRLEPLDSVKPGIDLVRRISRRKKDSAEKELRLRSERGEPIPPRFKEKASDDLLGR